MEVNTYPQCPATDQLVQSLVDFHGSRENPKLVDKFRVPLHGALPKINFKIFAKTRPSLLDQDFFLKLTSKNRTLAKCSVSFLRCILPAANFPSSYRLHSPRLYFVPAYLPQKDERALPEVFQEH